MSEPAKPAASAAPAAPAAPPKRSGHRGQDVRDTVAEMAAKAHEISLEAGSKMAASMKEVVGAAAGLVAFSIESARDLVQYMVRRGQMTQDEADKLVRSAEEAWIKKHKGKLPPRPSALSSLKPLASLKSATIASPTLAKQPAGKQPAGKQPAGKQPAGKKPAAKKAATKPSAAKKVAKKKPTPKKPAAKKAAKKVVKKAAAKKVAKKK